VALSDFDMDAAYRPANARTRKSDVAPHNWPQAVVSELAKAPLSVIAAALDKDDSTASRVRSGEARVTFNEALALLKAIGFKAVPRDAVCVRRDRYEVIAGLAQAAMADPQFSRRLIWEDE
jgi:hypothetical protein